MLCNVMYVIAIVIVMYGILIQCFYSLDPGARAGGPHRRGGAGVCYFYRRVVQSGSGEGVGRKSAPGAENAYFCEKWRFLAPSPFFLILGRFRATPEKPRNFGVFGGVRKKAKKRQKGFKFWTRKPKAPLDFSGDLLGSKSSKK